MDGKIHDRLVAARARLRDALEHSLIPEWMAQPAQRCLIDMDCALASGIRDPQVRLLLAQADALITVVDESYAMRRGREDADSE